MSLKDVFAYIGFAIIIIIILSIPTVVDAGEGEGDVYIHGVSYHFLNRHSGLNEFNPGISYKWDTGGGITDNETEWVHVGVYYNSIRNISLFALTGYEYDLDQDWRFGFGYGLATGYETAVIPAIGAYVEYKRVNLSFLPGVAALSWRTDFEF